MDVADLRDAERALTDAQPRDGERNTVHRELMLAERVSVPHRERDDSHSDRGDPMENTVDRDSKRRLASVAERLRREYAERAVSKEKDDGGQEQEQRTEQRDERDARIYAKDRSRAAPA